MIVTRGFLRGEALAAMRAAMDYESPIAEEALDGLLAYLKGGLEDAGLLREGYVAVLDIGGLIDALSAVRP